MRVGAAPVLESHSEFSAPPSTPLVDFSGVALRIERRRSLERTDKLDGDEG